MKWSLTQRLAIVIGVALAGATVFFAFTSVDGGSSARGCGTAFNPKISEDRYNSLIDEAQTLSDRGELPDSVAAQTLDLVDTYKKCDIALSHRRTLVYVFAALLVTIPAGVMFVGGAFGSTRANDEEEAAG